MTKEYMYPDNLKGKAVLWLWHLQDIGIIGIGSILSVIFITRAHFYLPMAGVAVYGFLSIRFDETSILDFIKYAFNFFILQQQYYVWQKDDEEGEKR